MKKMLYKNKNISQKLLKAELLRSAKLTTNLRWILILLVSLSFIVQWIFGFKDMARWPIFLSMVFAASNLVIWYGLKKGYNPRYYGFMAATIDLGILFVFLDGLHTNVDQTAIMAAATTFMIPVLFLMHTLRLDKGLMIYAIIITLIGFNLVYFVHYSRDPEFYQQYLSFSPINQIYKSAFLTFSGLLCIYIQKYISRLLIRQLEALQTKNSLDLSVMMEQQKNEFTSEMLATEKNLNKKLEEEIKQKDILAQKLQENKEQLQSIVSNLRGAVYRSRWDEYFTTQFGTAKILNITGYPVEDFIDNKKLSFRTLIHPEDEAMVAEGLKNSVETGEAYSLEFRIFHKEGHIVWVQINGHPVYSETDNTHYIDGIVIDITEKKEAEQALLETREALEKLNKKLERTVEERTAKLTEANTQLLKLQKENLQSQFEVLKQQVNPHFLFNSLNVLTSLIKVDPDLAELFTERLSKVYRYVLENKDKDLVPLSTEMDFIKAYIFLLDTRFAHKVHVELNVDEKDLDSFIVPLALQLLVENAIKHNTFSRKSPLHIRLFVDEKGYLNIINNLQTRQTQMNSTGIGLVNISKRYSLLSEVQPVFEMTQEAFIAKIPLIVK